MKQSLLHDVRATFISKIDSTTGFLTSRVTLARTGVQDYYGFELGLQDRATEKIGVLRKPEEVFHADSIKSFTNLVVTDDHPSDFVTTDNVKELQKGQVSEVAQKDQALSGVVTITDKNQIKKIDGGKIEVSVGYSNKLVEEKGTFDGKDYEFVQTNIRANHLAIVDAGRCGPSCKITDENKKEKSMFTITIDGIQYQTEDAHLHQAVNKLVDENGKFKKKGEEDEEEKEEMKKAKDKLQAEKDALQKDQMNDVDLSKLITERAELIAQSKSILGDKMTKCMDCPMEMKTAVIDHVIPDMELSDKSDDYISALYDMAVKKAEKTKKNLTNLSDDFKKEEDQATRDSARAKYMKDELGIAQ